ncbi:carbohydrate ABC transporter permease [bacterium]|nr:carbohydrate ABC transporter permease [bacterium]
MTKAGKIFRIAALTLTVGASLFPLIWMLGQSLKGYTQGWSFQSYVDVWNSGLFGRYFFNSVLVALCVTCGNLLFCSLTGYFFARQKFPYKNLIFASVLLTLIIPAQIVMVPMYVMMHAWGWLDSYWALIVPWLVNPFGIFLMKQYFESLPVSIEESAKLDGANDWSILFKIVMPIAKPALAVLGIYIFVNNWNQFLFPFLFVDSDTMRTLPVGLAFYSGYQDIDIRHLMAGASIASIPMILVFLIFQRQIIAGLVAGSIKE